MSSHVAEALLTSFSLGVTSLSLGVPFSCTACQSDFISTPGVSAVRVMSSLQFVLTVFTSNSDSLSTPGVLQDPHVDVRHALSFVIHLASLDPSIDIRHALSVVILWAFSVGMASFSCDCDGGTVLASTM